MSLATLAPAVLVMPANSTNDVVHIYKYNSSDIEGPPATLYLHKKMSREGQPQCTCEFVSRWTGMTDLHGHWDLGDDDTRLNINFNCRQGTVPTSNGRARPLHASVMFRCIGDNLGNGEVATWIGTDDKGADINLVHIRSLVKVGTPPRMMLTEPL